MMKSSSMHGIMFVKKLAPVLSVLIALWFMSANAEAGDPLPNRQDELKSTTVQGLSASIKRMTKRSTT